MFVYNLLTRKIERGSITVSGVDSIFEERQGDILSYSPSLVIAVFPFKEPDTFSFTTLTSNPMGLKEGQEGKVDGMPQSEVMEVSGPILLDSLVISASAQSAKTAHQDGLQLQLKDPNNNLLSLINPGDWIVCWMFDNNKDAEDTREKLKSNKLDDLNGFRSGLKFVGKCLAPRKQDITNPQAGTFTKNVMLRAAAFSELDSIQYYDPFYGQTNMAKGLQFAAELAKLLNEKFNGVPRNTHEILSWLVPSCLGNPVRSGTQATPNSPLLVPHEISKILGYKNAKSFADILTTIIGVQKFDDNYSISASEFSPSPHKMVLQTDTPLKGNIYPQIAPFNATPLWSILEQHLIPAVNEMYSTLRLNQDGGISPHLIIRQIPFNSDNFVSTHRDIPATAFRSLPRWKVEPEMVYHYDAGKTDAMRFNYVHVQVTAGLNTEQLQEQARVRNVPRWDAADISRNGLRPYITSVNAVYTSAEKDSDFGQVWTDLATDRLIGAHLKLSGSIALVGVQEPICVGDNLEYDGFVFHIESVEHRLQVNPNGGHITFQTLLAISNGVPAQGIALPEIAIREFESEVKDTIDASTLNQPKRTVKSKYISKKGPVKHTINPAANSEEDD